MSNEDPFLSHFLIPLGIAHTEVSYSRQEILRAVGRLDQSKASTESVLCGLVAAARFIVNLNEGYSEELEALVLLVTKENFGEHNSGYPPIISS